MLKQKSTRIISAILFGLLIFIGFGNAQDTNAQTVGDLNNQIGDKQEEISKLEQEIKAFNQQIKSKQSETTSLKNQIAILGNQLARLELDVQATQLKIEQTKLSIQSLNLQIQENEDKIADSKEKIGVILRRIYLADQVSHLEALLLNESLADFFDELKRLSDIQGELQQSLTELKSLKVELENNLKSLDEQLTQEEYLKKDLLSEKSEIDERRTAQQILLAQNELSTKQFQGYRYQLQLEEQKLNSEIITIERQIREELKRREEAERFREFGPARLSWPVDPSRGITAYFRDPDYPFRYLFEHSAIDVRAYQGSPLKASESGYVARVRDGGAKGYSYIMLIHNDGLATVYGHVSSIQVRTDDFVTRGQVIGLSGGAPGTPGAGPFSTGPHLHYEVRLNGIPVNPLQYLP